MRAPLAPSAALLATLAALATVTALAARAAAQPILVKLANNVPAGKKPSLAVTAVARVTDLALDLTRAEDGAKSTARHPALRAGQTVTFPVGDGAPGIAHWKGSLTVAMGGGESWVSELSFETLVMADLKVSYRRDRLDLDKHLLEFQLNRPARRAEITVIGDDGRTLGKGEASYGGEEPGAWLPIRWEAEGTGTVMKLELRVTDVGGLSTTAHLTPWSVSIPHEEVNFATDSAVIEEGERPKLDAAHARVVAEVEKAKKLGVKCSLFVAGHTDTVGSREHNLKLSLDRAASIAGYFRKKGLAIPIAYEGFGEDRPKVKTPDETDERQNRRADYVLSADPPSSLGPVVRWKDVK